MREYVESTYSQHKMESNVIYPENIPEVPNMQKKFMEEAAALICMKLPIPAEVEVAKYWKH